MLRKNCGSLHSVFKHAEFNWLCLAFSLRVARWIKPASSRNQFTFVNIIALQEEIDLSGSAREFAETKGYGALAVDNNGWTLLHHAAVQSQHGRGMRDVFRGLLEAVPIEVVDQRTGSGTPTGWSALSLVCNARDATNSRVRMVEMLLEKRADMEVTNPGGSTPLMHACACGFWSVVRLLLDARADHTVTKQGGRNALDVTPRDQTRAP